MTHTAWVESSLAILLNVTAGKTLGKCVKTQLLSLVAGEHLSGENENITRPQQDD